MIALAASQFASSDAMLDKLRFWQMPSQGDYISHLATTGILQSAILLACGLVYLLYGWKVFKILVIVNAAIIGGFVGAMLGAAHAQSGGGPAIQWAWVGGVGGAALLAVAAWPLMKYAVSLMGGLAGSLLGYGCWRYIAELAGSGADVHRHAWAGALIGLVTLGLLAFIIFRLTVMIFTSFQGSLLTVSGILGVLMQFDSPKTYLVKALDGNILALPLLLIVPALIGLAFQCITNRKKSSASGGESG